MYTAKKTTNRAISRAKKTTNRRFFSIHFNLAAIAIFRVAIGLKFFRGTCWSLKKRLFKKKFHFRFFFHFLLTLFKQFCRFHPKIRNSARRQKAPKSPKNHSKIHLKLVLKSGIVLENSQKFMSVFSCQGDVWGEKKLDRSDT